MAGRSNIVTSFDIDLMNIPDNPRHMTENENLKSLVLAGERRALARAITLIESTREDHRVKAEHLLNGIQSETGQAILIGISGPPGAGKSTFIEAFGLYLTAMDKSVGVLAVDPSSRRTGGSILGDKTRMEYLARDPRAFIRPSPSGGTLGGVARRTRETISVLDAAGFDVVIVETVGVGQSEVAVSEMTDLFILLIAPGGGDELQGIKRGVMELADLVLVNKSDGEMEPAAKRTAADYAQALRYMRPKYPCWTPETHAVSALEGKGLDIVWDDICRFRDVMEETGELAHLRSARASAWMWGDIQEGVMELFRQDPDIGDALSAAEAAVTEGRELPSSAARRLLGIFRNKAG